MFPWKSFLYFCAFCDFFCWFFAFILNTSEVDIKETSKISYPKDPRRQEKNTTITWTSSIHLDPFVFLLIHENDVLMMLSISRQGKKGQKTKQQ